jgi:hypothetical protein
MADDDWSDVGSPVGSSSDSDWSDVGTRVSQPLANPTEAAAGTTAATPETSTDHPSKSEILSKWWEEQSVGLSPLGIAKGAYELVRTLPQTIEQSLPPSSKQGFIPTDPERDQARIGAQTQLAAIGVSPAPGPVGKIGVPIGPELPQAMTPQAEIGAASTRMGELGTPVAVPNIAARGEMAQRVAGALKEIPIAGRPLVKAAENYSTQIGQAATGTAEKYGSGNVLSAGDAAKTAMTDWITGQSKDIAGRLYDQTDALMNPVVRRSLDNTTQTVADIMARRANARIGGTSKAVDTVNDAITSQNGMNYQGTKDLRSYLGELMNQSILPEGMDRGELKQLYGSMTKDLRNVAGGAGGQEGLAAWDKANRIYDQISDRREALAKIIGKDASAAPERVLDRLVGYASTKSNADINRLQAARKAIGPQAWDEVSSAVVNRMGRDRDGNFSPDRFLTAYGNVSQQGKQLLFNSTGKPELSQALDDIATLSRPSAKIARLGNPSGTGRVDAMLGLAAGLATEPHKAIATLLGGNILARAWSSPITAQATSRWMQAYQRAKTADTAPNIVALRTAGVDLARKLNRTGVVPKVTHPLTMSGQNEEPPMKKGGRVWKTRHDRVKDILDRHGATL